MMNLNAQGSCPVTKSRRWPSQKISSIWHWLILLIITIILSSTLMLVGCAGFFIKPYGAVASDAESVRVDGAPVVMPQGAPTISQGFRPYRGGGLETIPGAGHEGIDIFAPAGTPVIAPAAGTVTDSYFEPFYGNRVVIKYGKDENGMDVIIKLLHLEKRFVTKGDRISRGQQVGTVGGTGLLAAYPHLHYEIRIHNNGYRSHAVNPHRFWADGLCVITCYDSGRKFSDNSFRTTYPVPCRDTD